MLRCGGLQTCPGQLLEHGGHQRRSAWTPGSCTQAGGCWRPFGWAGVAALAQRRGLTAGRPHTQIIHCRWAMLGAAGCLAPEVLGKWGVIPAETGLVRASPVWAAPWCCCLACAQALSSTTPAARCSGVPLLPPSTL